MGNKVIQEMSLYIARFVRDGLETLHGDNAEMSDENMPAINTAIRKAIYRYFLVVKEFQNDPVKLDKIMNFMQPPKYREKDCFEDVEKEIENLKKIID